MLRARPTRRQRSRWRCACSRLDRRRVSVTDLRSGQGRRRRKRYPDRILRAPALAGKQVSRRRGQLRRRAGHCAIHAANSRRNGLERSFRSDCRRSLHRQNFFASSTISSEISGLRRRPTMRAAAGSKSGFHAGAHCLRKRALTSRSSPATRPKRGPMKRIPSPCRPNCRRMRRAKASAACHGKTRSPTVNVDLTPSASAMVRKAEADEAEDKKERRRRRSCALPQVRRPDVAVRRPERQMPALSRWQARDRRANRGNRQSRASRQILPPAAGRSHRRRGEL